MDNYPPNTKIIHIKSRKKPLIFHDVYLVKPGEDEEIMTEAMNYIIKSRRIKN